MILLFGAGAALAVARTKLARVADVLTDRTGLGEVLAGALFVGGSTGQRGRYTELFELDDWGNYRAATVCATSAADVNGSRRRKPREP